MKRLLIAILIMAGSINASCGSGWINVNDKDRDAILDKVGVALADLLKRVDDLQATVDVQRSKLSMDLQQLMGLTMSNLHATVAVLTRSVDTMKVAFSNLQQATVAEVTHVITTLGEQVDALQKGLSILAADTIQRVGSEIERQRVGALRQMQQLVQTTVRPTMERLSREGDYFVGKITFAANVLLVRLVAGGVAMIALIGLGIALLRLKAPSRRWPAVGVSLAVLLGAFSSATVLAAPISRIGAIEHKIPDGKAICNKMSELGTKLKAVRNDLAAEDLAKLAVQVRDAAIDCSVMAPIAELADLARDYFVLASEINGERIKCTTSADCLDGKRCDAKTGECLTLGDPYCEVQTDCKTGAQCNVAHRRCVVDGACTTPVDCRPEQACDPSLGRCVIIADLDLNATCEVTLPGVQGPCKQGKVRVIDRWVKCAQTTSAIPERCDGVDNNCNGTIDEATETSDRCTASNAQGECAANGHWRCDGAAGLTCVAAGPQSESCNGLDDDCDGHVDDGLPPGSSCSAGVGECEKTATWQCRGAIGMQCIPGSPTREVCDGKDNNCDGKVDNDLAEVCRNGKDDNCDGRVDEGCPPEPPPPRRCPFGKKCCEPVAGGLCEPGACVPRDRECR